MNADFLFRHNCPACASEEKTLRFNSSLNSARASSGDYVGTNTGYSKYHDMFTCTQCKVLYMNPIDANLDDLCANVVDHDYLSSWEERSFTFKDHLETLKPFISSGDLLDVGCYAGIFLEEAKKSGFRAQGIEPSKWAADYARIKVNATVYQGMFDSAELPKDSFDVVTMWDVVEHLANPQLSIQKTHSLLRKDGFIAITTHDIESLFARVLGPKYPWLMRFHLVHFSPRSLSEMLIRNGFHIRDISFYKKSLSINYFLKRIGIETPHNGLTKKRIAFNTGDMFMIVAQKKST